MQRAKAACMGRKTAVAMAVSGALSIGGGGAALAQDVIEEVVVTGIRGSLAQSIDLKRDATGVVDAIVQEDIGKFPDLNLAESLQRVTGVSIDRDGGEGQAITVRGLGPQFNSVLVNGRQIATDSGGREFNFDVLTAEFISSASVYKSGQSHLQEGGIGATVDIRTARPLDNPGFNVTGSLKGVHETLSEETAPGYSVLLSHTMADDKFGFLLSYSEEERDVQRNRITTAGWWPERKLTLGADDADTTEDERYELFTGYVPQNWDQEIDLQERTRTNLNYVVQFAPSDNLTITLDGYESTFEVDSEVVDLASWFESDRMAPAAITPEILEWAEGQLAIHERAVTKAETAANKIDALDSESADRAVREKEIARANAEADLIKAFGTPGADGKYPGGSHPTGLFVVGANNTLVGFTQEQNVFGASSVPATDYVSHTRYSRDVTNEGFGINVEWDFSPNLTGIFDWSSSTAENNRAGRDRFNVIGQENNYTFDARGSVPTVRHVGYGGASGIPPADQSRNTPDAEGDPVVISEARMHYNELGRFPTDEDEIDEMKVEFVFTPDSGALQQFRFGAYLQEREKSQFQIHTLGGVCAPCGYTRPVGEDGVARVGFRPYDAENYFSGLIDRFYTYDGAAYIALVADEELARTYFDGLLSDHDGDGAMTDSGTAGKDRKTANISWRAAQQITEENAIIDQLERQALRAVTTDSAADRQTALANAGLTTGTSARDLVTGTTATRVTLTTDPASTADVAGVFVVGGTKEERDALVAGNTDSNVELTTIDALVDGAFEEFIEARTTFNSELQPNRYTVNEEILSLYGDATVAFEVNNMPVTVNLGFRYAETETATDGVSAPLNDVVASSDQTLFTNVLGEPTDITRGRDYSHLLHSLSVKMELTDSWVFRFANYDTLTRPTLDQLSPATTYGEPRQGILNASGGNPELVPFVAENFDLSLEWYYGDANAASFTLFYKDVDNFIVNLTGEEVVTLENRRNTPGNRCAGDLCARSDRLGIPELTGLTETYVVNRPRNGESAEVKGFEVAWTHVFDIGLGFSVNATVVDSDATLSPDPSETFALEGVGDSQNVVVFWEEDRWQIRAAWNNRDSFLQLTDNGFNGEPVNTDAYEQWDISASFEVNENFTLFFEGINITEEERTQTGRFRNQIYNIEDNGARYIFGVRGSL